MAGIGGGSGTAKRTARFVADFEVFKLDFNAFVFSLVSGTCDADLIEELLDWGAVEVGVAEKESAD